MKKMGHYQQWAALGVALGLLGLLGGCASEKKTEVAPTPAAMTGPEVFLGTVGSYTGVQGLQPLLVSGYGFVVGLNGKGAGEVPQYLRPWLTKEMRRQGVGGRERGLEEVSPDMLMQSKDTAAVRIQGLIPPGAVKGTKFDLLVTAVDSQTLSLEGGKMLFPMDLGVDGDNPNMPFTRPLAKADGHLFLDPIQEEGKDPTLAREAMIIGGGTALQPQNLMLVLHQPSATRARLISDRINERYRHEDAREMFNTAWPLSESLIQINIPAAYANRPLDFLEVIQKLYIQREPNFETMQAGKILAWVEQEPKEENCRMAMLAWQGLGALVVAPLREGVYRHKDMGIRLAGLEAGARIGDVLVMEEVGRLVQSGEPAVRKRCAEIMSHLPQDIRALGGLKDMLDDKDLEVRLAAYHALQRIGDSMVTRQVVGEPQDFKFMLDLVPARRPLVYVVQEPVPTLAIFAPNAMFKQGILGRVMEDHLMIRTDAEGKEMQVFAQTAKKPMGDTYKMVPAVATLALFMAQRAKTDDGIAGMDLTYSQVVAVLYQLHKQGVMNAEFYCQTNAMAQRVAEAQKQVGGRPEVGTPAPAPRENAGNPTDTPMLPQP